MKDNPNLVTDEELLAWTHFKTRAPQIRWLDQQGIEDHRGAGGRVCAARGADPSPSAPPPPSRALRRARATSP